MDSPVFISFHWGEELKIFRKNLEILKDHPDKDAIHDLRVAIKKFKAILEIYILISGENLIDNPLKQTEVLFKTIGRERDIDICLERSAQFSAETGVTYEELSAFHQSMLKKAKHWTAVAIRHYNDNEPGKIKVLLKNDEPLLSQESTLQTALSIIKNQLLDSRQLLKLPHKLRQHLKKIFYWVRMLPGELPTIYHEKELHDITDDLGLWQDNEILLARVRHFRSDFLPKTYNEYADLKNLATAIKQTNKILLGKALRKTRKLLKTVNG